MKSDTSLRHLRPSVIMPASLSLRGPHFPSAATLATCLLSLLQLLPSLGLCAGHFFSSFLSLSELSYFIFSITLTTTGKYIIYFLLGLFASLACLFICICRYCPIPPHNVSFARGWACSPLHPSLLEQLLTRRGTQSLSVG